MRERVPIEDEDGGLVGWVRWDDAVSRTQVANGYLPTEFYLDMLGAGDEPALEALFGVGSDGAPMCLSLTIKSKRVGRQVLPKDLDAARTRLNDWMEVAHRAALRDINGNPVAPDPDDVSPEAIAARRAIARTYSEARRRTRLKVNDEHLAEVAELYRANIDDGPWLAIRDRYGVAESTAARYVMLARKAGLLPPTEPGKKKA